MSGAGIGITGSCRAATIPIGPRSKDHPTGMARARASAAHAPGATRARPAGGRRLVWKARGLGKSYATVSVVGDRIYTVGDQNGGNFIIALNAADGKQVWTSKLGKPGDLGGYVGPRAVPTVDGEQLFS